MIFRHIDNNNDWTFGKGLGDYTTLQDAINDNIKTRILSWLQDCFFAPAEGVDWKSRIDLRQQPAVVSEVSQIILRSFGVVRINSVDVQIASAATRLFQIQYNIDTIYGTTFQTVLQEALGS